MNIIGKKNLYFLVSLIFIIPGIVSLVLWGLNLGIDFTGGSKLEVRSERLEVRGSENRIIDIFRNQNIEIKSIQKSDAGLIIRTKPLDEKIHQKLKEDLEKEKISELSFQTIGPTIGRETTDNAFKALGLASILIVLYITWSFRKVPKPASSFRFGICAIIALLHDVLVVVGIFSFLGHFLKIEIDSLFVTALLTIIGFSVHDTIVVFDRIRENLIKLGSTNFSSTVNESILQTLNRSLTTSLTVVLVLISLLLFGGETIRWFVVALLIGIISGTYSSIFNAAPLLVLWQELKSKQ